MATVKGMVYLDMKPMKNGEIEFEVIAQPAIMLEVKDGVFEGEVYTGKNTVRVHQYVPGPPASTDPDKKPTKKESLPARYNSQTSLSEDVPEGGKSDLKYHVTSK
jgi:hypothetical protein